MKYLISTTPNLKDIISYTPITSLDDRLNICFNRNTQLTLKYMLNSAWKNNSNRVYFEDDILVIIEIFTMEDKYYFLDISHLEKENNEILSK